MNPNIAFVGKAGSGKSTAADLLQQITATPAGADVYVRRSFAEPLKQIAETLWGADARTDRDKLQKLGVAVREIERDTWVDLWTGWVEDRDVPVVTDDLRFENEWWAAKALGFVIVRVITSREYRIDRLRANGKLQDEAQLEHESETAIDHLCPDYVLSNDGSKIDLADAIIKLLDHERDRR